MDSCCSKLIYIKCIWIQAIYMLSQFDLFFNMLPSKIAMQLLLPPLLSGLFPAVRGGLLASLPSILIREYTMHMY